MRSCLHGIPALVGILLVLVLGAHAQETPTIGLDRTEIYLGESVRLTLSVPGASDADQPDLSGIPNVDIAFEGSRSENRTQITIINGRMRKEGFQGRHYTWRVTPREEGTIRLGPIHVTAGRKTWTLDGPLLQVHPIPPQDFCQLELTFSPSQPVPEESAVVSLWIRFRRLPAPYSETPPWLADQPLHLNAPFLDGAQKSGLEIPDIAALLQKWRVNDRRPAFLVNQYVESVDPFGSDPFFAPSSLFERRPARFVFERVENPQTDASWITYRLDIPVKPLEEGDFPFGPITLKGEVIRALTPDRRPILAPLYAVLPSQILRVRPPPLEGRPASFFGLIGSNLVADVQLETSRCRVGDPIRLILRLSGPFHWTRVSAPDLSRQPALMQGPFQFYPQAIQTQKEEHGRTWQYLLRPRQEGTLEIPPLELAWYDLAERAYRTLRTPPIPLQVEPAPEWKEEEDETVVGLEREDNRPDVEKLRSVPAALRMPPQVPAHERLPLWAGILALAGPFLRLLPRILGLLRRIQHVLHRHWRRAFALSSARRQLRLWARPSLSPSEKASQLCRILRRLVAEWTGEPVEGLTPEGLARLLERHGAEAADARAFEAEMQRAFEASFNPAAAPLPEADILSRLLPICERMDRRFRSSRRLWPLRLPLFLVLVWLVGAAGAVGETTESWKAFAWEEAMAAAAQARTPDEFRAVAERFDRMIRETGIRNGDLFYNAGVCQLLAGDPDEAWRLFVRAERYLGRPADLVHNMALVGASGSRHLSLLAPVSRLLFWPHFGIPWRWRAIAAAAAFSLWALLVPVRSSRRVGLRAMAAAVCLAVVLFFGASTLLTAIQEYQETRLLTNQP